MVYNKAKEAMKGLKNVLEKSMDLWMFKEADIGMAYVRRLTMEPEWHETAYGPPEQHLIMDNLPMKYAITTNEWEQYDTFTDRVKNETCKERCYINRTPTGHTIL